jgi:hypothetical protein
LQLGIYRPRTKVMAIGPGVLTNPSILKLIWR